VGLRVKNNQPGCPCCPGEGGGGTYCGCWASTGATAGTLTLSTPHGDVTLTLSSTGTDGDICTWNGEIEIDADICCDEGPPVAGTLNLVYRLQWITSLSKFRLGIGVEAGIGCSYGGNNYYCPPSTPGITIRSLAHIAYSCSPLSITFEITGFSLGDAWELFLPIGSDFEVTL